MTTSVLPGVATGALGLLAGLALSFTPTQLPQGQDETEEGPPLGWRQRQQHALDELRAGLIGSWTLTEFEHVANDLSGIDVAGYLGITEDLLTIVLHTADPTVRASDDPRRFQAGVHHWRLSENSRLQTASVLGHSNFAGGQLSFESLYTTREYELVLSDRNLSLIRADGSSLRFLKLPEQAFPEAVLSGFGAPLGTSNEPPAGTDEQP